MDHGMPAACPMRRAAAVNHGERREWRIARDPHEEQVSRSPLTTDRQLRNRVARTAIRTAKATDIDRHAPRRTYG
jgi:hypothetical protein